MKRIVVDPDRQVASHRQMRQAAHWIVLKGTANTIIGGVERTVGEGGSLHVPQGAIYQLSNLGKVPLEIIEVRTGAHSSEDDIPRPTDISDWKRSKPIHGVAAVKRGAVAETR